MEVTAGDVLALAGALSLQDADLLLVADGSGSTPRRPCGWCCFALDVKSGVLAAHSGGASSGTSNLAELLPFVHALWAYEHQHGRGGAGRKTRVGLVSDSEVTVKCGNGEYARTANSPYWAAVAWFERSGYTLRWRHVRRNSNAVNALADRRSRASRAAAAV